MSIHFIVPYKRPRGRKHNSYAYTAHSICLERARFVVRRPSLQTAKSNRTPIDVQTNEEFYLAGSKDEVATEVNQSINQRRHDDDRVYWFEERSTWKGFPNPFARLCLMLSGCLVSLEEQTDEMLGECSERLCTSHCAPLGVYRSTVLLDACGLVARQTV